MPKWLSCVVIGVVAAAAIAVTICSCGAASAAIAPFAFIYFGIAANTTLAITTAVAITTSVGIAAFAIADMQSVITDGKVNYLSFLNDAYEPIEASLYFTSFMFSYVAQFAQPGWGKQTTGIKDAPKNGPQYGKYTKITPQGNDVTIYNDKGQAFIRYDFSHSHDGMIPHIHYISWWKYNGWRWNGPTGKVYPFNYIIRSFYEF